MTVCSGWEKSQTAAGRLLAERSEGSEAPQGLLWTGWEVPSPGDLPGGEAGEACLVQSVRPWPEVGHVEELSEPESSRLLPAQGAAVSVLSAVVVPVELGHSLRFFAQLAGPPRGGGVRGSITARVTTWLLPTFGRPPAC